jgi:hypothetical protein
VPRFSHWIKNTVLRRTSVADDDLIALATDTPVGAAITAADLRTSIGGVQSDGSVTDIVVLTAAAYAALPVKDPTTIYNIVG